MMRSKLEESCVFQERSFPCSWFLEVLDGQQPARVKTVKDCKQAKSTYLQLECLFFWGFSI